MKGLFLRQMQVESNKLWISTNMTRMCWSLLSEHSSSKIWKTLISNSLTLNFKRFWMGIKGRKRWSRQNLLIITVEKLKGHIALTDIKPRNLNFWQKQNHSTLLLYISQRSNLLNRIEKNYHHTICGRLG